MIYNYASSVVTMDDVELYFKGESWPISKSGDGKFLGESVWNFRIELEQKSPLFDVVIKSKEDDQDSKADSTEDPVKFISEFLSEGMSESELVRAASDSNAFSILLKKLAASIESTNTPSLTKVSRLLRRISVINTPIFNIARGVEKEVGPMLKRMKDEGWKAKQIDKNGVESIHVDIGDGLYDAEITPEKMIWNYKMEFKGDDGLTIEGETTDPIAKYMEWKKNPELGRAWKDLKAERAEQKLQNSGPKTVPAKPRKK